MTSPAAASGGADPALHWRWLPGWPDLRALRARDPARYPALLESVAHGTPQARYDLLFACPASRLELDAGGRLWQDGRAIGRGDFLDALDAAWRREARPAGGEPGPPPFRGGWFVYLGYELAAQVEPRLELSGGPGPRALALRIPLAVLRDHASRRACLVWESQAETEVGRVLADLDRAARPAGSPPAAPLGWEEDAPQDFLDGVQRVQAYIRAGDVFQVNLSRGWRGRFKDRVPVDGLYAALCAANPAPFAAHVHLGENHAVLSSSPERLVAVRGDHVSTRPIAGTHPRGVDGEGDRVLARALLAHPKERAEHIMLVDLERNDLGRVCRAGTVQVEELMVLESYRHVHHIVSQVGGRLAPGWTPGGVLRAVFPGGTITGCPKVRCMEIIAELERGPRGAYTGSLGYINHDGSLDLNILIRTLVCRADRVELRAGAGIVADSRPQRELAETRAKARGLLRALGVAG